MTGHEFKLIREFLRLKQSELGNLTGYTRQSISEFENEKQPIPRALELVMRLLELHPEKSFELMGDAA